MSFLLNRLKQDLDGTNLALIRKNLRQQIRGLEDVEERFREMARDDLRTAPAPKRKRARHARDTAIVRTGVA
ncbi:MAG: hypothetical protein RIB59_04555 [Rhodospirillales bacterium]